MSSSQGTVVDKRIGHYQIVRMLGSGGMGQVFEAVHDQMKRRAAIKLLHKRFANNRQIATRFLNEAKATSIVEHPGIVHIYEFGQTDDGTAYIVMEYLSGETLRQRLDAQGGKLPPEAVMRLGRQMASALQAAHEKGIVHRESTPPSIPSRNKYRTEQGKSREKSVERSSNLHLTSSSFWTDASTCPRHTRSLVGMPLAGKNQPE